MTQEVDSNRVKEDYGEAIMAYLAARDALMEAAKYLPEMEVLRDAEKTLDRTRVALRSLNGQRIKGGTS